MKLKRSDQYFSMFWDLDGKIEDNGHLLVDVAIKKMGGNLITFYIKNDEGRLSPLLLNKVYTLKIIFEDGQVIHISGETTRTYESGCNIYYEFNFSNIDENVREQVFKQIFKKQIQLKQLLWKVGYGIK